MFLLTSYCKLNENLIVLCDDKQIVKTLSCNEVIVISDVVKTLLSENIHEKNICLGLLMDHNIYIPSLILSIHKLEHAFMFLTLTHFDKMVSSLKLNWILSFEDVNKIPLFQEVNRFALDEKNLILWKRCKLQSISLNFQNVFCVVQTSGSTGDSKLIRVTSACIERNISSLRSLFDMKSVDIIFWGSSLTFDPSLIELILALESGASLLIVPYKVLINPKSLYKALFDVGKITFLQMVPSIFMRWNEDQIKQIFFNSQLKILAFGGEHFPKKILSYKRRKGLRLFNLYGITEVSCWATVHEISDEVCSDIIPIGNSLEATIVELRDEFGKVVNQGKGEVFIGSSSRKCYINEESPSEISGTVFRETGDVAVKTHKGIFLLGRKNKIIKRYGHRINLSKLENKILVETGLENRCVWSQENNKLLTFILMKKLDLKLKQKILDKLNIKLINTLTEESFPDYIDIITNFPLTSHGKVNEKALEKLYCLSETSSDYLNIFKMLWCKYVGISDENLLHLKQYKFLEIGGNSISALQLLSEFKERIDCDCPNELVTMIFENTCEECLQYLTNFKQPKKMNKTSDFFGEEQFISREKLTNLKIVWSYNLKSCIDGSPVIFEKGEATYIAVGSFSHKFVVFHENGEIFYETSLPDSIESTPTISPCRNFILVGCFNGVMYCVHLVTKQIVWQFATGSKIKSSACFGSTLLTAIFGSYDKCIYCVTMEKGSKLWNTLLDGSICANPISSHNKKSVFVTTTKGSCFCLKEDDGQIVWKTSCGGPIFGTPCLGNSEEHLIVPTVQGVLLCLHSKNGELIWKYKLEGHVFSSVAIHKNYIILGCHDKNVYILGISLSACHLVQKFSTEAEVSTTPFVYSIKGRDFIASACNSGVISVTGFDTFELLGRIQLPGEVFSSPVVYNKKIFVGCRDNHFYCIALDK